MGLDESDVSEDSDSGRGGFGKALSSSDVSCSICLESVVDNGDRSWAKLLCGHLFHLDCIGSAFNVKGVMRCPNCRKIEKGQWLYATGCRWFPEFSLEGWAHNEDLHDLSYSEMSFGVQWCPFIAFSRVTSLDEPDFPSSAYRDFHGQSAIFAEHTAVSSAAHPCPYFAYFGPIHSSSASSGGSVSDGSFSEHWIRPSGSNEIPTYGFPAVDPHYHNWEPHPSSFSTAVSRTSNSEQFSVPPAPQSSSRSSSDVPRLGSYGHPFLVNRSSGSRAGSSVTSTMVPPYPGSVARTRDRVQALQAYFQQPSSSPSLHAPGSRRSSSHRGQSGASFIFPSGPSTHIFPEAENTSRLHRWGRERFSFSPSQVEERDSNWGICHRSGGGTSALL